MCEGFKTSAVLNCSKLTNNLQWCMLFQIVQMIARFMPGNQLHKLDSRPRISQRGMSTANLYVADWVCWSSPQINLNKEVHIHNSFQNNLHIDQSQLQMGMKKHWKQKKILFFIFTLNCSLRLTSSPSRMSCESGMALF